jgi:hypothetical protein
MMNLNMWALNIYALIGFLLLLGAASVVLVAVWTGLKMGIWSYLRRRSRQAYLSRTRRADGQRYPPVAGGVCDHCHRVSKQIYYSRSGPRLCSPCYEAYWREEKAGASQAPVQ